MPKKHTIKDCHTLAESHGFKCLSTEFTDIHSKLTWQCTKNHIWSAAYNDIRRGGGCPYCSGKAKHTIDDCHKLAESRGFKCLSTEYINANSTLIWQCEKGHIWKAKYGVIGRCMGCKYCNGTAKHTIADCHTLAESRGFKCLSTEYVNNKGKLIWQCENGHIWEATYNNIYDKYSGCPHCQDINQNLKNEKKCRRIFKWLFNLPFPKIKPNWLKNPKTKRKLELDGYNKGLNLAFEYNGEHHYSCRPQFHQNYQDFEQRQNLDKIKIELCEMKEVTLIVIPYTIGYRMLEKFIVSELARLNVPLPTTTLENYEAKKLYNHITNGSKSK